MAKCLQLKLILLYNDAMINATELSQYRKKLKQLIDQINGLAFYCAYSDPLIQGTPGEVYRTCGSKKCLCASDPKQKHGPYPVIQIYQNKKQRQVSIKKEEKEIWTKAKNYQKQYNTLLKLKETSAVLADLVREILDKRIEKWPV